MSDKPNKRELDEGRRFNKLEMERIFNKFLYMSRAEFNDFMKKKDITMLELLCGQIMAKGVKDGDEKKLDFFLTRLVGKTMKELDLAPPERIVEANYVRLNVSGMDDKTIEAFYGALPPTEN